MKRILTILLVVMMVFSFTACDAEMRANLASLMGSMGQNLMGSDTSSVAGVVANTEVKTDDIVKPTVDGEAVKVSESITIKAEKKTDGQVVTKVAVAGVEIEVAEEVKAVLPPMKAKDETIRNIGSAMKNDAAKDKLIADMKEPVKDESVKEAAKGTATVMKSALSKVAEDLPKEKVPEAVKESLKNVSESLEAIAKAPETVTQADVVTLQLVNDFVETVAKNSEKMKAGEVPAEVLTDANNLFTVSSALSEASKFNPNTLVGALVSGMGEAKPAGKALARAAEAKPETSDLEISPEYQMFFNVAYDAIKEVLGEGNFAETKSGLGFHKMSYENYVNMVAGKVNLKITEVAGKEEANVEYDKTNEYLSSREFSEFKSFTGLTQYLVASMFSEGDDYYQAFINVLNEGKYDTTGLPKVDTSKFAKNIRDFILDFAAENPWVLEPTKDTVKVVIPANYADLMDLNTDIFGEVALNLMTGRGSDGVVKEGQKQYFRTALDTVNKMIEFTDLSSISSIIGNTDLNYMFLKLDREMYVEAKK